LCAHFEAAAFLVMISSSGFATGTIKSGLNEPGPQRYGAPLEGIRAHVFHCVLLAIRKASMMCGPAKRTSAPPSP
jgi:hypothetical protein